MSQTPPPGWWLASDGRWYPPEAQPGYPGAPVGAAPASVSPATVSPATVTAPPWPGQPLAQSPGPVYPDVAAPGPTHPGGPVAPVGVAPMSWAATAPAGTEAPPRPQPAKRWVVAGIAVVVVAGAVVGVVLGTSSSGPGTNAPADLAGKTPAALVRASISAAGRQSSFETVASSVSPDSSGQSQTQRTVTDSTANGGTQTVTEDGSTMHIIVDGARLYVRSSTSGLENFLDVPTVQARAYAGRWLSLVPTDKPYSSTRAGITISSVLNEDAPDTSVRLAASSGRSDGQPVTVVRATARGQSGTGTETFSLADASPNLPVSFGEQATTAQGNESETVTFSHWGEHVDTTPPPHPVSYAQALGSSSS